MPRLAWRVMDGEKPVAQGTLPALAIPDNGLTTVGKISVPLAGIKTARKLQLEAGLRGGTSRNRWNFWVYPEAAPAAPSGVLVVNALDGAAQQALRDGKTVVLLPSGFSSPYPTAHDAAVLVAHHVLQSETNARPALRSETPGAQGLSPPISTATGSGSSCSSMRPRSG